MAAHAAIGYLHLHNNGYAEKFKATFVAYFDI